MKWLIWLIPVALFVLWQMRRSSNKVRR